MKFSRSNMNLAYCCEHCDSLVVQMIKCPKWILVIKFNALKLILLSSLRKAYQRGTFKKWSDKSK